jgi:hypothetical protein
MRISLKRAAPAPRRLARAGLCSIALSLYLVGCGGGASDAGPGGSTSPLTAENAWSGPAPAGAELVSTAEFERRLAAGTIRITAPGSAASERAALDANFRAHRAALLGFADRPAYVQALLEQSSADSAHPPDTVLTLPSGEQASLLGRGAQMAAAVDAMTLARSADNALLDYTLTHELLPTELKTGLPAPDSLRGRPVEDIRAALGQINQVLDTPAARALTMRARIDAWVPEGAAVAAVAAKQALAAKRPATVPLPGAGTDADGNCFPLHDARIHWFPLKNFLSPMKQQWARGTCWAFAAIGAVESRELVLNGNSMNLSEQFLINKVRREWFPNDMVESGSAMSALNAAVQNNQALPLEASWTYNPSTFRSLVKEKVGETEVSRYVNSCGSPSGREPYGGTCSDSAHQSRQVCTDAARTHCAYATVTASGPTVPASRVVQLWQHGAAFDLARYEFLLNNGHVLLATLPIHDGFVRPTNGLLSDLRGVFTNDRGETLGGSGGDHVVQIVGFVPDNEGGRFIIKNSWGCRHGDAGYVYVPASYVQARFHVLHMLQFESRRSDAWKTELASQTAVPELLVPTPAARAELRVELDLTRFFTVSHGVRKSVHLQVSSNVDGMLFDGPWSTDASALIPPQLPLSFATEGDRVITLSARLHDSTRTARSSFNLSVRNSAPTVTWQSSGTAFVGEAFPLNALVRDINQSDSEALCRNATWSVEAPDVVLVANGCSQRITFGAEGERRVQVTVRDAEGLVTSSTLTLSVQAPPLNPFPRVLSYGVFARELTGGVLKFCGDVAQAPGTTLDLRARGCTLGLGGPNPGRFHAALDVENPTGEPLSYEWKFYVKSAAGAGFVELYGGFDAGLELGAFGNNDLVTRDCHVDVKVIAPEPTRNKRLTVWSGRCTYFASGLR